MNTPVTHAAAMVAAMLLVGGCGPRAADSNPPAVAANGSTDRVPPSAAGAAPNTVTPVPAPADPALAVDAEGLRLFNRDTGAARPLSFGMARADVIARLAFRGPPGTGTNGECGAGPLDYASWPDGLTVYFQQDRFAGWALDGRAAGAALTTASGVGIGTTRANLAQAYAARFSQTTIGTEFAAGDLYGVLDCPGTQAKVTNMWAGVSCVFR